MHMSFFRGKVGMVSGLFFGFAFGMAGIGSAVLGGIADRTSIEYVYEICAFMPLIGLITAFLPNIKTRGLRIQLSAEASLKLMKKRVPLPGSLSKRIVPF
jgi:hypothetical protein